MGICASKSDGTLTQDQIQARAGAEVDVNLLQQEIDNLFKFKILLLGAGESGKSTIVKQLKLLHKCDIESKEKIQYAQGLHQNVLDCVRALTAQVKIFKDHEFTAEEAEIAAEVDSHPDSDKITKEQAERIIKLVKGAAVSHALSRRHEFWLLDSFDYYMQHLLRFAEPEFDPTEEDILMARIRTTGIVATSLKQRIVSENKHEPEYIYFEVVDVGGQRNERKKWLHCFDDVKAVLFIVSLAGWDQVLFEDNSKNRMEEAIELFEKVANTKIFEKTPLFLLLNKKDLFEQMIKEKPLSTRFPDYTGGDDVRAALDYLLGLFKAKMPPGKLLQSEYVSARVKGDIRTAFNQVKKTLYEDNREMLVQKAVAIKKRQKERKAASGDKAKTGC